MKLFDKDELNIGMTPQTILLDTDNTIVGPLCFLRDFFVPYLADIIAKYVDAEQRTDCEKQKAKELKSNLMSLITDFINNPCLGTIQKLSKAYNAYKNSNETCSLIQAILDGDKSHYTQLFFEQQLPMLVTDYSHIDNPQEWTKWFGQRLTATCFNKLKYESNFYKYLVTPINQGKHPVVGNGVCTGVALIACYDTLLNEGKLFNEEFSFEKNISKFEACQINYYSIWMGIPRHILITPTALSFKTPWQSCQDVTQQVMQCINDIIKAKTETGDDVSYAMQLCLSPNIPSISATSGHCLGIAITKDFLYFTDANIGIFKVPRADIDTYAELLSWVLYEMKYCHIFNNFVLENWNILESHFPTPEKLIKDYDFNLTKYFTASAEAYLLYKLFNAVRNFINIVNTGIAILYSLIQYKKQEIPTLLKPEDSANSTKQPEIDNTSQEKYRYCPKALTWLLSNIISRPTADAITPCEQHGDNVIPRAAIKI